MNFDSTRAVVLAALFLVPGFIMASVRGRFVRRKPFSSKEKLLQFFTLSCVNNVFWFGIFIHYYQNPSSLPPTKWLTSLFVAMAFVWPTALALVSVYVQQQDWIGKKFTEHGFKVIHPAPSAWDWHMSRQLCHYVSVKLKSGEVIQGWFGANSIAGDDTHDLFIETVCEEDHTGLHAKNEGVWIPESEIVYITFLTENADEQTASEGELSASADEEGLSANSLGTPEQCTLTTEETAERPTKVKRIV